MLESCAAFEAFSCFTENSKLSPANSRSRTYLPEKEYARNERNSIKLSVNTEVVSSNISSCVAIQREGELEKGTHCEKKKTSKSEKG